jgi:chemotaxis protein CheD
MHAASKVADISSKVGQKNGATARCLMRSHGMPITAESRFGADHRQIVFDVNRGHVGAPRLEPVGAPPPEMKAAA